MAKTYKPRLALGRGRRLRKPEKHLAALDAWAETFEGHYPEPSTRPVVHWHLPADERLVSPPLAEAAHQAHALRAMLRAAAFLRAARPADRASETIYVITHWPAMVMAEVGVFLDPEYARSFEVRTSPYQTWAPLPAMRDLARELDVAVPPPFIACGYHETSRDEPDAPPFESEIWLFREPFPAA